MISPIDPRPNNFLAKLLVVMTAALTCSLMLLSTSVFGPLEVSRLGATPVPTAIPTPTPLPPTPTAVPAAPAADGSTPLAGDSGVDLVAIALMAIGALLALVVFAASLGMVARAWLQAQRRAAEQAAAAEQHRLLGLAKRAEQDRFIEGRRQRREQIWRERQQQWQFEQSLRAVEERMSRERQVAEPPIPPASKAAPRPVRRNGSRTATRAARFVEERNDSPNGKHPEGFGGGNGWIDPFEEAGK